MLLSLIICHCTYLYSDLSADHIKEVDRETLSNSKFFEFYKQTLQNESSLRKYLRPYLFMTFRNKQKVFKYFKSVFYTSLEILEDEKLDRLLYIIINTKTLRNHICDVSHFAYSVVNHVYRIYNFCMEEKSLFDKDMQNEELFGIYSKIIHPNVRIHNYIRCNTVEKMINKLMNKIKYNGKSVEYFCKKLFDIELSQFICDLDGNSKIWQFANIDIFSNILLYDSIFNAYIGMEDTYILLQRGNIRYTLLSNDPVELYTNNAIDTHFRDYNTIYRSNVNEGNLILDKERLSELIDMKIYLSKYTLDIFIAVLIYYNEISESVYTIKSTHPCYDVYTFEIKSLGECIFVEEILSYYKKMQDDTSNMKGEIARRIEDDKNHEFITIIENKRFTFNKPNEYSTVAGDKCLQLECEHFLGHDLIEEYLRSREFKCYMCNRSSHVMKYFEASYYEIN